MTFGFCGKRIFCAIMPSIDYLRTMADVHVKKTRSYNMSRIKGENTKPEIQVRKFLFSKGYRYKLHDKKLTGKPDIVLPKLQTVIFVHGCFWHGHENCRYFILPKTNISFWKHKIQCNKERDLNNINQLEKIGWKVMTIYECELKGLKKEKTLNELLAQLLKLSDEKV